MNKLIIDLGTLPEEGKQMSGELEATLFDLGPRDPQPKGPLSYDLWIQRFEGEILLQGSLSCPFEFECVRTLHPFIKTIRLPKAALSLEIGNFGEVDATEALREELLLEVPNHPTCDIADTPQDCEIDSRYLAVDNPQSDSVNPAPPEAGDSRWSALDALDSDQS
ncbi:hypothetical protein [Roseibacillus ishigakijimensis]|uniref:DUF177 domain-containing protein n=1 Tax=Roseibacillus ishigakijimensis TaxID=454146 RepID=A0A934RQV2_9BACT|nr:hypothetical protein [Roseibacillus ishigakijimensis]MBK1835238.1 hypothetical protein [Roseibacillus ishigakijimensis]